MTFRPNRSPRAAAAAAAGIALTCLTAQQPPSVADPRLDAVLQETVSPIRSGPVAPNGEWAGLWAGGRNYKVSFHDGKHIGPILIEEDYSLVDLPVGMPREIFRDLKKAWICGHQLRISRLGDAASGENRRGTPPKGGRSGKPPKAKGPQKPKPARKPKPKPHRGKRD
jgi:ATP-dependent RNA helicase DeaD